MLPWHFLLEDSPIRKILLKEEPDIIEIYDNYALTYLAGMIRTGHFSQLKRPMLGSILQASDSTRYFRHSSSGEDLASGFPND
ncbi:MAG: hypothetical protein IPK98_12330 [Chloracidobacterium sp.]|nr:hypothetical protein [Chloracidobacterium sp.]